MRDIEEPINNWLPPKGPEYEVLEGEYCVLAPLKPADAAPLFKALSADKAGKGWRYMPVGPFASQQDLSVFLQQFCAKADPMFFSITDKATGQLCGFASYLRINPTQGSIEVGYIYFSPQLQKTRAATETMYLMMKNIFDLGYRRYEWKCNAANAGSMQAAKRLGFSFEGIFRQAMVIKGRNRDTAWFSVLNGEWPEIEQRFKKWLDPSNFDQSGAQIVKLN